MTGSAFQILTAATGNVQQPMVDNFRVNS